MMDKQTQDLHKRYYRTMGIYYGWYIPPLNTWFEVEIAYLAYLEYKKNRKKLYNNMYGRGVSEVLDKKARSDILNSLLNNKLKSYGLNNS